MNAKYFILGGSLVLAAPAFANDPESHKAKTEQGQAEKLPHADMEVLKKLHQANREEIELGQVAQRQSERDEVKQFGKMMVDDHRMADEKVTQFADQHGVTLADDSDAMKKAEKFGKKTGKEFDKDYLEEMVKGHDKVISMVNKEQKKVKPELQTTLTEMLPTLEKHKMEAKRLLDEVKGSRAARSSKPQR
jgi:putative membrane protein